ncbi:MAG: alpha/beta hydrolase [Candidatus Omnitrophota bacterium]
MMIKLLIALIAVFILLVGFVRYFEANSIFHPTTEMPVNPNLIGFDYEDVYFKTQDNLLLNGWFIKSPGALTTVLFFHGNAGNISHRLEKIVLFRQLGLNTFIIDYRGYGKSEGKPTEEGIYKDASAALDYLSTRDDINRNRLIVYGDSLGGVVAVDLASRKKVAALIVDSSFPSAADVSKTIFPFIPSFFLRTKMDSAKKVKQVTIPKLFIHSTNDEIIPFALGKKLFDLAGSPKEFLSITGGHNTNHIDSHDVLIKNITQFLKKNNLL